MKRFLDLGEAVIAGNAIAQPALKLIDWTDFPLAFTVEYPVVDFASKVGFFHLLGFSFLSVDKSYAIVRNQNGSTFSFQQSDEPQSVSIKLQWFTSALDLIIHSLEEREITFTVVQHSSVQRIVRLKSPNGIPVEFWSGDES